MDLNDIKEKYPEIPVGRAENLSGKIFNHWTVLYRTKVGNSPKPTYWVCMCDCEKKTIKPVLAKTLVNKTSTNCGCQQALTTSQRADNRIHQRNEKGEIVKKRCSRCGEWLSLQDFWKNCTAKDGYGNECKKCQSTAKENRYNQYKKGAKARSLNFSLNKDEFYNLTSSSCFYCGLEPRDYNGIDRIDSAKGYELSNCVPCCAMCNKMKLDYSVEEWIKQMKRIIQHLKEA